jgi:hypothetical protein
MPSFEELFLKSKGRPVKHRGKVLQMVDHIDVHSGQEFILAFESTNSKWRQGVYCETNGVFIVLGQELEQAVVLWSDTSPNEVMIKVKTKNGKISIRNVWDTGDGIMHSWHNGGAMIVETHDGLRRYKCNDGFPDDDFDDLVFSLQIL